MKIATKKPISGNTKVTAGVSSTPALPPLEAEAILREEHKGYGYPYELGEPYLIRTVTMANTGLLVGVTPTELVLIQAAWVADTGRFANGVATGEFSEVEPFPPTKRVIIGRGAIIDAVIIPKLPLTQK